MPSSVCDQAGCSVVALWQRAATLVANHVPERLCGPHYQQLVEQRPALAGHYDPFQPFVEDVAEDPSLAAQP